MAYIRKTVGVILLLISIGIVNIATIYHSLGKTLSAFLN
ncbi:MAG: hypothetical protein RLZZ422_488 [Pseudomonadota bacterium]|jgi:hypothetical protein